MHICSVSVRAHGNVLWQWYSIESKYTFAAECGIVVIDLFQSFSLRAIVMIVGVVITQIESRYTAQGWRNH